LADVALLPNLYALLHMHKCVCVFCRQTKLTKLCHSFLVKPVHYQRKVIAALLLTVCSLLVHVLMKISIKLQLFTVGLHRCCIYISSLCSLCL